MMQYQMTKDQHVRGLCTAIGKAAGQEPGGWSIEHVFDGDTVTISLPDGAITAAQIDNIVTTFAYTPPPPTVVSYEDFDARFTQAEQNDIVQFVYATDPATGKLLRPQIVQGYNMAVARNQVDLLSPNTEAFLSALVAANVLTEARKSEVLDKG